MNELTASLQYDFNAIDNGTLADMSGNGFDGTIETLTSGQTGCTIIYDPVMGNCMEFDGVNGYVSLPALPGTGITDFSSGITIGAWVNFAAFQQYSCILNFGQSGGGSDNITLQLDKSDDGILKYNCVGSNQSVNQMFLPSANAISINTWIYVAVTVDASGNGALYLNGQQVFVTSAPDTALLPAANVSTFNNFIGKSNWSTSFVNLLQGRLAWLSVYNQALTQDQVNADMLEGEKNRSTSFRKSFPVEFKVYSDNGGDQVPVLYIEQQGNGKDLYLEIINNSSQPLTIPQGSGSATQTNYHFHLHFRPGTLSDNFLKQTSLTINNWSAAITTNSSTGTNCISFLRTGSSIVLGSGESHLVEIGPVNANPVGGARGTNIELLYDNVQLGTSPVIKGSRMQHLTILSQLGQKDIPLHVGIVGSPSILNDGATQNELLLRIANTGSNSIALSTSGSSGISEFEIEILIQPTGELTEWALVDESDTGGLQLTWPVIGLVAQDTNSSTTLSLDEPISNTLSSGTEIIIQPPSGSAISATLAADGSAGASTLSIQSAQSIAAGSVVSLATNQTSWQIGDPATVPASTSGLFSWTINNLAANEIVSGGSIDFLISGIVCSLPSGQSFITIRYYNIPGYWDGEFRVAVQKSPLVTNGQNVGIGTASPSVALEVSGAVYAYGNSGIGAAPSAQASLNIPYPSGSGNNGLVIGDPSLCTTQYSALSIVIPNDAETLPLNILSADGSNTLFIDQAGDIQTGGNVLLNNSDAKLGIGTASPSAPLHINANQTSLLRIQSTSGGQGNTAGIDFVTYTGEGTSARIEAVDDGNWNGSIAFLVSNSNSASSSPTEAMRITNEGNVGIGTDSPSESVQISANNPVFFLAPSPWSTTEGYGELRFGDNNHFIRGEYSNGMTFHDSNKFRFDFGQYSTPINNTQTNYALEMSLFNYNNDLFNLQLTYAGIAAMAFDFFGSTYFTAGGTNSNAAIVNGIMNQSPHVDGFNPNFTANITGTGSFLPLAIWNASSFQLLAYVDLGGGFHTISDQRFKKNITRLEGVIEKLIQIRGISFNWKDEAQGKKIQFGVLAQEVERVFPELVNNVSEDQKMIHHNGFTPILIEAVKELKEEVEEVKKENLKLKEDMRAMKEELAELRKLLTKKIRGSQ